ATGPLCLLAFVGRRPPPPPAARPRPAGAGRAQPVDIEKTAATRRSRGRGQGSPRGSPTVRPASPPSPPGSDDGGGGQRGVRYGSHERRAQPRRVLREEIVFDHTGPVPRRQGAAPRITGAAGGRGRGPSPAAAGPVGLPPGARTGSCRPWVAPSLLHGRRGPDGRRRPDCRPEPACRREPRRPTRTPTADTDRAADGNPTVGAATPRRPARPRHPVRAAR